ncbi:MAG: YbaB/EbfC family nucleoid-associated protein [Gemmataceae bacterium]
MFKELGMMAGLLGNRGKMQEEMQKLQAAIGNIATEATTGDKHVTVRVNGRMELQAIKISDAARALDSAMLEDLILAATNQAMAQAKIAVAAETAKMAENMGIPPAMLSSLAGGGFPGIG